MDMKLETAIAHLSNPINLSVISKYPELSDAVKLGYEAMKHLEQRRIVHPMGNKELLPGEAEE